MDKSKVSNRPFGEIVLNVTFLDTFSFLISFSILSMVVSEKRNSGIFSPTNYSIFTTPEWYLYSKRAKSTGSEVLKSIVVFISSVIPRFSTALLKNLPNFSARVESSEITLPLFTRLILEVWGPLSDKNGFTVFYRRLLSIRFIKLILMYYLLFSCLRYLPQQFFCFFIQFKIMCYLTFETFWF